MGKGTGVVVETLAEQAARAAARLEAAGIRSGEARPDAAILARWVLGWDAARWLAHRTDPAAPDFAVRFAALIERRARREPVAYIIGEREFYGRTFIITPDVLIPRPETELVVEESLRLINGSPRRLVDVGTGSGCLAVTLALECPTARIDATDASPAAIAVARENARRFGVLDRIGFEAAPLLGGPPAPVDLIVANPPYVALRDRSTLEPEVRDYEPPQALFGGADGLDVIRAIVRAAARALAPGGWLVMEIGAGQADDVAGLIDRTTVLRVTRVGRDLQGIPRVIVLER
jgi:release factor glutamine methyltransferase